MVPKSKKRATRKKDNRPIYTLDCETDPFEYGTIPQPFIWGLLNLATRDYREFATVADTAAALIDLDAIVYAHNGGKFDFHYLADYITPDKPLLVIGGRMVRCEIGKAELRDSFSILPFALAKYKKTKMEYWKLHKLYRAEYMDEIRAYLRDDCSDLGEIVSAFISQYGLHITQATAAMKIWQKMAKRQAPNTGPLFYDIFRPYYYGGRVQCFQSGDIKKNAVCLDINSAYPFAMMNKHPISIDYAHRMGAPGPGEDWGPMFFNVRAMSRGALPYLATNRMLYFPNDGIEREYTVTGHELIAGIETETIETFTVLSHYKFSECIDFKDYINHFWNLRLEAKKRGDVAQDLFCKIFMNGLYGKFAANPRNYYETSLAQLGDLEKIVAAGLSFDHFGNWLLVQAEMEPSRQRFYNIATAASITGYVRAMLWRALVKAKNPMYCDTDSITAESFPGLDLGDGLGQWKLEAELDRVVICGKKLYAMHKRGGGESDKAWKVASKGARLKPAELIRIAAGETVKFYSDIPTYSVHHKGPRFIDRRIKITAADASIVPPEYDPQQLEFNNNVSPVT